MKIAIFTNNYLPNPYGVSMSIESFRKELEKCGHTVYIFSPENKGFIDDNANVFRYPSIDLKFRGIRFPLVIPFSRTISKKINELEIDIIHSQHPNLLGWAAKRWAKKKKVPLVFTWHTLYDQYSHFVPLIPEKIVSWWTIRNAVKYANNCNQIIVPTPSVANIIQSWGVINKNICAVPSGVDKALYQNFSVAKIREKYEISKDEILILLVSRLTAEKNIRFLFDAMITLIQKNKQLKFLVAGEGQERAELEKIVRENDLNKNIFFAGVVPADRIKNYYAAADIFVHASKSETQGMILTEAMYMGLPIVAIRATGAKDLIGNFMTGILTKEDVQAFAQAVLKLVNDPSLRLKYSQNAKKIARENYTSVVCGKKMLKIYQEVIARN